MKSAHEIGRSYDGNMLDITGAKDVEIQVGQANNGKVIWINVDGICVLRVCRIKGEIDCEIAQRSNKAPGSGEAST